MKDINLEEKKIKIEGSWFTAEEIAEEIQKKMKSGDMKIAAYAAALEALTVAVESSHVIDVKMVLSKDEYNRLKALGNGNDVECVRKAVRLFLARKKPTEKQSLEEKYAFSTSEPAAKKEPDKVIGKCALCKASMEIPMGTNPESIVCAECSKNHADSLSDSQIRFKDHFLG